MRAKYVNIHCEWCGHYIQPTFVHAVTGQGFNVMDRCVYAKEISVTPLKTILKSSPTVFRAAPPNLPLEATRFVPPTPIGTHGVQLEGVVVVSGHMCPVCKPETRKRTQELRQPSRRLRAWELTGIMQFIRRLVRGNGPSNTSRIRL